MSSTTWSRLPTIGRRSPSIGWSLTSMFALTTHSIAEASRP
jgi:hypothetical protein